jgi:hypothetical protein
MDLLDKINIVLGDPVSSLKNSYDGEVLMGRSLRKNNVNGFHIAVSFDKKNVAAIHIRSDISPEMDSEDGVSYEECIKLGLVLSVIMMDVFHTPLQDPMMITKSIVRCVYHKTLGEEMNPVVKYSVSQNFANPMLEYFENSCYLDSLLTTLLFCGRGVFRDILLNNPTTSDFENAKKFIREVYTKIFEERTSSTCIDVRKELLKFIPQLQDEYGNWETYPVDHVYSVIAEKYHMAIPFSYETYVVNSRGPHLIRNEIVKDHLSFSFEEFMTTGNEVFGNFSRDPSEYSIHKMVNWGSIGSDYIVFYNSNTNIRGYNTLGTEQYAVEDETVSIKKTNIFDETIIDGRYHLVGVISLVGVIPGEMDSGRHYTSWFKDASGRWYEYDDLKDVTFIGFNPSSLVKHLWFNYSPRHHSIPVMYFYEKISPTDDFSASGNINTEYVLQPSQHNKIDYWDTSSSKGISYGDRRFTFNTTAELNAKLEEIYLNL